MNQINVKTAFLYSLIESEVYVNQPHNSNNRTAKVCQLLQALYGHKRSSRVIYETLPAFLKSYGMSSLNADLSVDTKPGLKIAIFINDLLITGGSTSEINAVKAAFQVRFRMSDLRLCKFCLGMTVTQFAKNECCG